MWFIENLLQRISNECILTGAKRWAKVWSAECMVRRAEWRRGCVELHLRDVLPGSLQHPLHVRPADSSSAQHDVGGERKVMENAPDVQGKKV